MTLIIAVVSQKGGVGKSTLVRALAKSAAENKMKVKVADLDTQQGTTMNWHRRRLDNGYDPVGSFEVFRSAEQALSACGNDVDLLIIDAPARASKGTRAIAESADLVVQPTGASLDDLEPAILVFHEMVKNRIPRDKLAFAICRVGTDAEYQDCRDYLGQTGYTILDGCIPERPSYRQTQNLGLSVLETRYNTLNDRADELMQSLVKRLEALLG